MRHCKFAVKCIVTALVILLCTSQVNELLIYKVFADHEYATSPSFMNFYELDRNSVDVLILGSSHAQTSIIPQELYDQYGITSYNLGSNAQSVVLSYYILRDVLRTQQPEVVVLETYMLFPYYEEESLNCTDSEIRRVLNHMQLSPVKLEAIYDLCSHDEDLNALSYLLTNIQYHDRWKELDENDFRTQERRWDDFLMGYELFTGTNDLAYEPLQVGESDEFEDMMPLMEEYLDKITALCGQSGIELVLVKTPTTDHTIGRHNTLQQYAEENGILFYDFNEEDLYILAQFDFSNDLFDYGHLNYSGALKMTTSLGDLLQGAFDLTPHEDAQWDEMEPLYADAIANYDLVQIENLDEYLTALTDDMERYTIFITSQDDAASSLGESSKQLLRNLGLMADWTDAYRNSYCGIVSAGEVLLEAMSEDALSFTGSFLDGSRTYSIGSGGYNSGISCTVTLNGDGSELTRQSRGLNIVVYDNENHKVVDSVCFDTYDWSNGVIR